MDLDITPSGAVRVYESIIDYFNNELNTHLQSDVIFGIVKGNFTEDNLYSVIRKVKMNPEYTALSVCEICLMILCDFYYFFLKQHHHRKAIMNIIQVCLHPNECYELFIEISDIILSVNENTLVSAYLVITPT